MAKVTIIADLGFGDAGKGSLVDYLVRAENAKTVVRYNGGAQAAHNVVSPEGIHHTFSQFGSGTLAGAKTHLSRFVYLDPLALLEEGAILAGKGISRPFSLLSVDGRALLVTPYHQALNRLRESARKERRHGSCGAGVGETAVFAHNHSAEALHASDLRSPKTLKTKLSALRAYAQEEAKCLNFPLDKLTQAEKTKIEDPEIFAATCEVFEDIGRLLTIVGRDYLKFLLSQSDVIFEGAQGVLLDQWYGFHPYTTWSKTTLTNAYTILKECESEDYVKRLGIMRGYMTRHGPGPFPTYCPTLTAALPDNHNKFNPWQGDFRVGYLDLALINYSLGLMDPYESQDFGVVGPIDDLVITCLDRLDGLKRKRWPVCVGYGEQNLVVGETVRGRGRDPERQQQITKFLFQARPKWEQAPGNINDYVRYIEESLTIPAKIISVGPQSKDKSYRTSYVGARD